MQHLFSIWKEICESNLFNFFFMVIFFVWIIKKFELGKKIEQGRKNIENSINDSETAKEESLKNLYSVQEDATTVDKTMLEILDTAEKSATSFGQKIIDESKKLFADITENSKKAIEANVKATKTEITKETAQNAVTLAEKHIKSELKKDSSLHYRYIDESLNALESIDGVEV